MDVTRRDFLFLKAGAAAQPATLSCETLYMRFLDSQLDGSTARLFSQLADDLQQVDAVRLLDRSWLTDAALSEQLAIVLGDFRKRGGRID